MIEAGTSPPNDKRPDPFVAGCPGARTPQKHQSDDPPKAEHEAAEKQQHDRRPFPHSASVADAGGWRLLCVDYLIWLAEAIEHTEHLGIRHVGARAFGQVHLDVREEFLAGGPGQPARGAAE